MKKYSQDGQDLFVFDIFKNKTNGVFVDIGAHDGITLSNTFLLEQNGWNGLCVEPLPKIFEKLIVNRKCKCVNGAISDKPEKYIDFCCIDGYSEMLSGILDDYNENHKFRILNESKQHNNVRSKIKVRNYRFNELVNTEKIDYLSIDTEGSEFKILKSIDYNKYKIKVIGVENNYNDPEIKNFLEGHQFEFISSVGADWFFINNSFSV